mmetsp:Transcript_62111/g.115215  ORF Transcript_62111/g.115215 Transcript_62111/m.115215 type:complete len:787 (-) Transcript_62111:60-2420(-)
MQEFLEELNITSLTESDIAADLASASSDEAVSPTSNTTHAFSEDATTSGSGFTEIDAALYGSAFRVQDESAALEERLRFTSMPQLPPATRLVSTQPEAPRAGPPAAGLPFIHHPSAPSAGRAPGLQLPHENPAEASRLQQEVETLRATLASQSAAQTQLTKEHAEQTDRLSKLQSTENLLRKDCDCHERNARVMEESLARRGEEVARLEEKVVSLLESNRALASQAASTRPASDQVVASHDVAEQVDLHIRRFKEQATADLEAVRLREEVDTLRSTLASQSAAQAQLTKEHAEQHEHLSKLQSAEKFLRRDCESYERRARLLEESLARRDEEVAQLQEKVASLREKKRELAKKAVSDQALAVQEVSEQVDSQIKRFKEQATADLEAVRTNLNLLHAKEVQMFEDRCEAANQKAESLQRRLDDEEQAHQALQLSSGRIQAELNNEITELRGILKLRAYEVERCMLTQEEVSTSRLQLKAENEKLKEQNEVLKKEYYNLEVQHREGRAAEHAELVSLREQLRCYMEVERELDAAIRACAEGPLGGGVPAADDDKPAEEAYLLGAVMVTAPTSSQRRIQQSLLLAQEVQRRSRELAQAKAMLQESEAEKARLQGALEAARNDLRYTSEPQAYLLENLRQREKEIRELKCELRTCASDLERSRKQAEQAIAARVDAEEDIRQLLSQRTHLNSLQAVLGGTVEAASAPAALPGQGAGVAAAPSSGSGGCHGVPPSAAEHRGRAPSQQQAQGARAAAGLADTGGLPWYHRLKQKLDGAPVGRSAIMAPVQSQ